MSRTRPFKDFGQGFYLSADYSQALERARQVTEIAETGKPVVTEFEWDIDSSKSDGLRIKIFDDYCEEWGWFVYLNRNRKCPQPVHNFDIVIGPIADDGVSYQLRRFENGDITMKRLIEELKYSKGVTIQYCFGTQKALSYLKKI